MWGTKAKTSSLSYSRIVNFLLDWIVGQGMVVALVSMLTAGLILWIDASDLTLTYASRFQIYPFLILVFAPFAIISLSAFVQQRAMKQYSGQVIQGWVRDTMLAGIASTLWFAYYAQTSGYSYDWLSNADIIIPPVLFIAVVQWRRLLLNVPAYYHGRVHILMMVTMVGAVIVMNAIASISATSFFAQMLGLQLGIQACLTLRAIHPLRR